MFPVTTTTTTTTFPPEIFFGILGHLAERPFEEVLNTDQVKSLQTCSLVCKQFASICRQLFFERVEVTLISGSKKPPIHPLVDIIGRTPKLLETVRELLITISDPQRWEESTTNENIDLAQLCFLQLKGLASLTILRARDSSANVILPTTQTILAIYIPQITLRSLTLDGTLPSDMWPHLLGATSLQHLSLRTGTIPRCNSTTPNVSIKRLHLRMVSFMKGVASVLSLFTALEDLELDLVFVNGHGDEQCWIPSLKLKSIKMTTTSHNSLLHSLILLDGMRCAVKGLPGQEQCTHFQNLHTLVLSACNNREWDAIASILAMARNIQKLDITLSALYGPESASIIRHIAPDIFNKCDPITHLSLKIISKIHPTASMFLASVSDIASLVDSVATSTNILELFSVEITILNCTVQCLNLSQWGGIAANLADASKFPNLQSVAVKIVLNPQDSDVRTKLLQQYDGEEELEGSLARIMRKLGKRQGVEFCAKLMLQPA